MRGEIIFPMDHRTTISIFMKNRTPQLHHFSHCVNHHLTITYANPRFPFNLTEK